MRVFADTDFAEVACPVCGGDRFEPLARTDRYFMGIRTVGCIGCGLVMTNPQPTDAALDRFYREEYRSVYQRVDVPDVEYIRRYKKDERCRGAIEFLVGAGALAAGSRVLDIGASEGAMLKAVADRVRGTERTAVEPNPNFRAFAEQFAGCTTHAALDEAAEGSYDLVIVNHVLEHVPAPVPFLEEVAGKLRSGGRLYIDVPSVSRYSSLDSFHVAHLYHFGRASLTNLLARAGFEVQHLEEHQPVMHPPSIRVPCAPGPVTAQGGGAPSGHDHEGWDSCRAAGRNPLAYRARRLARAEASKAKQRILRLYKALRSRARQ